MNVLDMAARVNRMGTLACNFHSNESDTPNHNNHKKRRVSNNISNPRAQESTYKSCGGQAVASCSSCEYNASAACEMIARTSISTLRGHTKRITRCGTSALCSALRAITSAVVVAVVVLVVGFVVVMVVFEGEAIVHAPIEVVVLAKAHGGVGALPPGQQAFGTRVLLGRGLQPMLLV